MANILAPTGKFMKTLTKAPKSVVSSAVTACKKSLLNIPATRITVLNNGIRVATEDTGSPVSTVGLYVDAGASDENDATNGVGHLFEHLVYKGTAKRSQTDLEQEVAKMGAKLGASTGRDMSAFWGTCLSQDVPNVVEILSDVIQNNKLDEVEVDKQRDVILKKLESVEKDHKQVVFDHLHNIAFQGTSYKNSVFGPSSNLMSFNRKHLEDHITLRFKAPRLVLAGAGGIEHESLVELAEKHFMGLEGSYLGSPPERPVIRFTGSEVTDRDDDIPFNYAAIAVEGVSLTDDDYLPMMVASRVIGKWEKNMPGSTKFGSQLARDAAFRKVGEAFEGFNISYKDTGLWGVFFYCHKMVIEEFVYNMQQEWLRMSLHLPEFDVARAKNVLRAELFGGLYGTANTCHDIGTQLHSRGIRMPLHELNNRIEALTTAEVRDACRRNIYDRCPAVAAVGPTEQLPDYNNLRSLMHSFIS